MAASPEPQPQSEPRRELAPWPERSPADRLEALLAELLERAPALDADAIDACCHAHPDLADGVRAHAAFLRRTRATAAPAVRPSFDRIGPFRLVRRIGGGGMGIVHLAVEEGLGREVALKLIRADHLPFGDSQRRFRREIEVVAGLRHPGIVPVLSCGEDAGVPYYAMELVAGRSLASVIADAREQPAAGGTGLFAQPGARERVDACFRIALQVAQALVHAHERGVVHRDVKPSNIMLDADGRARLIDFGLAHVAAGESMTRTGVQPGSLAYMSPEQVRGEPVDATTDVWSLGVTLYELLSTRLPFAGDTEERLRRAILESTPAPLHGGASRVPWDAAIVVATAMAPERTRRYRTMAAFAADLQAYLERRPIAARRPGALLRARRWVQRRPGRAAGLALVVAVLVVLPSTLLWQEHQARLAIEQEAIRARRAELDARRDANTAARVVEFLQDVFRQSRPDADLGRNVTARQLLDDAASGIRAGLHDEPGVRAALLEAMGSAYLGLGHDAQAIDALTECLRLREHVLGWTGAQLVPVLIGLGAAEHAAEHYAAAEALFRRALAQVPALGAPGGLAAARPSLSLAATLTSLQRYDEALALLDAVVATYRAQLPAGALQTGDALAQRGAVRARRMGADAAAADQDEALAVFRAKLPANHPRTIRLLCDVATREGTHHGGAASEALLVEAEAGAATVFEPDHPKLADVRQRLALRRASQGRHEEARRLIDVSADALARSQPPPSLAFARHLTHSASVARDAGDLERAAADALAATAMFGELMPSGSLNECVALDQLVAVQLERKRAAEAVVPARRVLELREQLDRGARASRCGSAINVVRVAVAAKDRELADTAAAAALRLLPDGTDPDSTNSVFRWLAEWLIARRRYADAVQVLQRQVAAFASSAAAAGSTPHVSALLVLGQSLHLDERTADAIEPLQLAHALLQRSERPDPSLRARVPEWLGFVLTHAGRPRDALPFAEQSLAIAREAGQPDEVRSATVSIAEIRAALGEHDAAAGLLWPVLDELAATGEPGPKQAVRAVGLMLELLDTIADPAARQLASERLQRAARAVLPPDHRLHRRLGQRN